MVDYNFAYDYISISVENRFIHLNKNILEFLLGKSQIIPSFILYFVLNIETSASLSLVIRAYTLFV